MSQRKSIWEVHHENEETPQAREKVIVRTSVIGIIANVFLAAFKAVIGVLSNSIAVILDAVNNISDAASSVITIVGTKLSTRKPTRKHPFGFGRIEYLTAMIIAVIVLYAGITSLIESIKKIISPEVPDYAPVSLVIIAVAVIVKLVLGRFVSATGKKVNSDALVNSGKDATMDAVISASVLLAALVFVLFKVSLEAWLGALISLYIIKTGLEMLSETISSVLGERVDAETVKELKKTISAFPNVLGVYDLILHNYGPDNYNGSVHIEVPDTCSAEDLDTLTRNISYEVYRQHHIAMTAVGIYARNTRDPWVMEVRDRIEEIAKEDEHVLQIHGFTANTEEKFIRFDVLISFDEPDRHGLCMKIRDKVAEEYPGYEIVVVDDADFTES